MIAMAMTSRIRAGVVPNPMSPKLRDDLQHPVIVTLTGSANN